MNFIEFASKAQEELNKEKALVSAREGELSTKATALSNRANELDTREGIIAKKEFELVQRNEQVVQWESKKKREEEVQRMADEANAKLLEAQKIMKKSAEMDSDSSQKLADILKRENALSDDKKTYRDGIKKEMMDRFLGGVK